jgi:hypothetical protein
MSSQTPPAGISTTTLIHAGVEIVVAAAIVYWVHSRTKGFDDQITILSDRIDKLEELIKKQGEIIVHHENALRQFHAMMQGTPNEPSHKTSQTTSKPKHNTSQNRKNVSKTLHKSQIPKEEHSEEESIDDDLANEIEDLNQTDLDCNGDECLVPGNKKK